MIIFKLRLLRLHSSVMFLLFGLVRDKLLMLKSLVVVGTRSAKRINRNVWD